MCSLYTLFFPLCTSLHVNTSSRTWTVLKRICLKRTNIWSVFESDIWCQTLISFSWTKNNYFPAHLEIVLIVISSALVSQAKEVANINGEKVENASEEEESEEVESEEEERRQPTEEPVSAVQEATSEPISQVGTRHFLFSIYLILFLCL